MRLTTPQSRRRGVLAAMGVLSLGTLGLQSWPQPTPPPEPKRPPYCAKTIAHGPDRAVLAGVAAATGCRYDTGFEDQSPSIQISRNGTLVMARGAGGVMISSDKGLNWRRVAVPALANGDDPAKGAHGYVHIDPVTDRLYYLTSMAAAYTWGTMVQP